VFSDEGEVDVYVPAGEWTSWWDGTPVSGPGWVRQRHGFDSLPLLVRPGAVIVTGSRTDRPDYDDTESPVVEVFGLGDGDPRTWRLFDEAGAEQARVEVTRDGERLRGDFAGEWTLRWNRGPSVTGSGALELSIA